jgi:hypothetical protein
MRRWPADEVTPVAGRCFVDAAQDEDEGVDDFCQRQVRVGVGDSDNFDGKLTRDLAHCHASDHSNVAVTKRIEKHGLADESVVYSTWSVLHDKVELLKQ